MIRRKVSFWEGLFYTGILSGVVWVHPISFLIQHCAAASFIVVELRTQTMVKLNVDIYVALNAGWRNIR